MHKKIFWLSFLENNSGSTYDLTFVSYITVCLLSSSCSSNWKFWKRQCPCGQSCLCRTIITLFKFIKIGLAAHFAIFLIGIIHQGMKSNLGQLQKISILENISCLLKHVSYDSSSLGQFWLLKINLGTSDNYTIIMYF